MAQTTMIEGVCLGIAPDWAVAQKARMGLANMMGIMANLLTGEGETYQIMTKQKLSQGGKDIARGFVQGIIYALR